MSDVKCEECGDNLLKDELPETRAKELEMDPMFVPKICWICHVRENDLDRTQWPEEHQRFIKKEIESREERRLNERKTS